MGIQGEITQTIRVTAKRKDEKAEYNLKKGIEQIVTITNSLITESERQYKIIEKK